MIATKECFEPHSEHAVENMKSFGSTSHEVFCEFSKSGAAAPHS